MPIDLIINHCSPTLAGLKTGNMFSVEFETNEEMVEELRKINKVLLPKGLKAIPLRKTSGRVLIYIYRPDYLSRDLEHPYAVETLKSKGYATENMYKCLAQLARRVNSDEKFPHEIGFFLGYPPEDVCAFIKDANSEGGCHCAKCTGHWKVYGDREAAEKKFAKYKTCTKVYKNEINKGRPLEQLIVDSKRAAHRM